MEFFKKAELFFKQLQVCSAVDCPRSEHENNHWPEFDIFYYLYAAECNNAFPFNYKVKILELKQLIILEKIDLNDALRTVYALNDQFWDHHLFKIIYNQISKEQFFKDLNTFNKDKEISKDNYRIVHINFIKHLEQQRKSIFNELVTEIVSIEETKIELKALENSIRLISVWRKDYIKSTNNFLKPNFDILKNIVDPFSQELKEKLLSKDTTQNKTDLIRHYLYVFFEYQKNFKPAIWILFSYESKEHPLNKNNYTDEDGNERELTDYNKSLIKSFFVFDLLIKEIIKYCKVYQIDFSLICRELGFSSKFLERYTEGLNNDIISNDQTKTETPDLSLKKIALMYAYKSEYITKENCDAIAKQFGHNSGHKLYQEFITFVKPENRRGEPKDPTKKKYENKIKLIQSVIDILEDRYKQQAIDELKILSSKFENEY